MINRLLIKKLMFNRKIQSSKRLFQILVVIGIFISWVWVISYALKDKFISVKDNELKALTICDSTAAELLGDTAQQSGLYEKAIEHYLISIKCKENKQVYNNLWVTLNKLWRESESIEVYKKAVGLDANYDLPLNNLADIYISKHFTAFRKKDWEWAIVHGKDTLRYARWEEMIDDVTVNMAIAYYESGQLYDSFLILNERLKTQEKNAKLYAVLGELYFREKSIKEAIQNLRLAVKLDPENTQYATRLKLIEE